MAFRWRADGGPADRPTFYIGWFILCAFYLIVGFTRLPSVLVALMVGCHLVHDYIPEKNLTKCDVKIAKRHSEWRFAGRPMVARHCMQAGVFYAASLWSVNTLQEIISRLVAHVVRQSFGKRFHTGDKPYKM